MSFFLFCLLCKSEGFIAGFVGKGLGDDPGGDCFSSFSNGESKS